MKKLLLIGVALALAGAALAHSYLVSATPAANARLRTAPAEVRLGFTEAVELRFSSFKVYPLEAPASALGNPTRLKTLAEALTNRVLRTRGDEAARADSGVKTQGRTAENVVIGLKEGLEPGAYVVMWRVLSVDTHTSEDFYVFVVQP